MFRKMRLRDKMTLWYTLWTLLAVCGFFCAVYFGTDYVLEEMLEREVRLSMTQVIAQVENENGMLTFENEVPISGDSMYFVTEADGSELASQGEDITLFDSIPVIENKIRTVQGASNQWLLLDSELIVIEPFTVRVRIATSCALRERITATLRLIFAIAIPVLLLASVLGGAWIAERSLRPVRRIVASANQIANGDLSARIPQPYARDELGELTDTLNHMLQNVESAFSKEKRFTSDASHELRTPVAIIRAYGESLLNDPALTVDQRSALTTLLTECTHMQKVIAQLLTITRGQEGRYPIHMENINLALSCSSVLACLQGAANEKQITTLMDVAEDLTLTADQDLLTELLINLTENAIKYGKSGGHVTLSAVRQQDGRLLISIADDGIGISTEALPHVFERFYREDKARAKGGTGLGLAIADWIVAAHHGAISIESQKNQGTTVSVSLPLVQPDDCSGR